MNTTNLKYNSEKLETAIEEAKKAMNALNLDYVELTGKESKKLLKIKAGIGELAASLSKRYFQTAV